MMQVAVIAGRHLCILLVRHIGFTGYYVRLSMPRVSHTVESCVRCKRYVNIKATGNTVRVFTSKPNSINNDNTGTCEMQLRESDEVINCRPFISFMIRF